MGIRCFERWSKHQDLENYANALEDWDDLVGDDWNEPDSPYLDPQSWIVDHPVQATHEDRVTELIESPISNILHSGTGMAESDQAQEGDADKQTEAHR